MNLWTPSAFHKLAHFVRYCFCFCFAFGFAFGFACGFAFAFAFAFACAFTFAFAFAFAFAFGFGFVCMWVHVGKKTLYFEKKTFQVLRIALVYIYTYIWLKQLFFYRWLLLGEEGLPHLWGWGRFS